jgi:hypothetical protein
VVRVRAAGFDEMTRAVSVAAAEPRDLGTIALPRSPPTVGSVVGRVIDGDGDPIVTATVEMRTGTIRVAGAVSSTDGSFRFSDVDPGTYRVWVNATGFEGAERTATITAGAETDLGDIELRAVATVRPAGGGLDIVLAVGLGLVAAAAFIAAVLAYRLRRNRGP